MAVKYVGMDKAVKMNYAELKEIVTAAAREARKRANRIFKSKTINASESPAIRRVQESRPRGQVSLFESRGKNRNQLLQEYKRIKNFMEDPTSTVKGTQAFYKDITEKVQEQFKKIHEEDTTGSREKQTKEEKEREKYKWSTDDSKRMFKIFSRLKKENPWVNDVLFKYHVLEMVANNIKSDPDISIDELFAKAESMLDDVYINVMKQYARGWQDSGNGGDENSGVDDYMDVSEDDQEEWNPFI